MTTPRSGWFLALAISLIQLGCESNPITPHHATRSAPGGRLVKIEATYKGRLQVAAPAPGAPVPSRQEPLVIRTREELEAFVSNIPKQRIQKKQPAPPSDDPLLKLPEIDFQTRMLLVARRGDTMYVHPEIGAVAEKDGKLQVTITYPPLGDSAFMAAQSGIGVYVAAVVPAFAGEVVFEGP